MPIETYEYRGQTYKTEEEAQQAKTKYNNDKKLRYIDAASVGFDKDRYDQLIANGQGISQMTDRERQYISDSFAKSDQTSIKYTKSDADKLLYELGMPPMKELSKYRIGYAKYTADGDFEQNYGHISDDQWKKINDLWKKDWQYGLTTDDFVRKAAGAAPVAFDDLYEDTLLDNELKEKGLPPSKLLNGKLGEAYNEWATNDATYTDVMNEIARRYVSSKSGSITNGYGSDRPFDEEERDQYDSMLMSDAILAVQNDPKYAEFFGKHYGVFGTVTDDPGNDYIMYTKDPETGEKYPVTDANGNYVYDTQKFMEDRQKTLNKNAALSADEFAITPDKVKEYVSTNELVIRADLAAEEWFKSKNVKVDFATRGLNEDYLKKVEDFANAYAIADEGGITLDSLYTDAKTGKPTHVFADDERRELQPLVDNLNNILVEQGASAVDDYFKQGKWAADVRKLNNDKIVAGIREGYAKESGFNDPSSPKYKSDEVILNDYYTNVAQEYFVDMDANEAAKKLMNGELSVSGYLSEHCKTAESAAAYAESRLSKELERMGVTDRAADINVAIFNRKTARDLWNKYVNEGDEYLESNKSKAELEEELNRLKTLRDKYDSLTVPDDQFDEWKHASGEIPRIERALKHLDEILAVDSNWENGMSDEEMENLSITVAAKRSQYLADALSYTEGYAASSGADVDERAKQIFDTNSPVGVSTGIVAKSAGIGLAGTLLLGLPIDVGANIGNRLLKDSDVQANKDELYSRLTDEEKQKLVYMSDTYGENSEEVQAYVANVLTRVADRRNRDEKKAETGWWGSDKSPAISILGAMGNTLIAPGLQPFEATANFYSDVENLLGEKDLYMSLRSNIFQDEISNIAETIGENAGEGWSFAYQLIPSIIQSTGQAVAAYFSGGASEIPTLIAAAMTSYSSAVDNALQQGATGKQAFLFGVASGTAEALFEKVSLDKFVKDTNVVLEGVRKAATKGVITNRKIFAKTWLEILKQMAVQGGIEASEETFTSLANFLSEQGILRYNSTFNKNVRDLMAAGLTEDEAWAKASENFGKEIFMDALGGFISGALMSGARSIVQTRAGTLMFDRTGMTEFLTTTHNLSLISAEDAVNYVRANIDLTGKTNITASQARGIMNDLIRRGADSAVLARARNEILSAKPSSAVETVLNTMVSDQAKTDATRLVNAAQKYIANNHVRGTSEVSKEQLATVTNEYLAAVQTRVQDRDILDINKAAADIRADYVDSVARLAGVSMVANGMNAIFQYNNTLSAERQAAIKKGAERYITKFKSANMTESDAAEAAQYSMLASIIHDACADTNSLNALSPLFGESATYSPAAVDDACLNATGSEAWAFIDSVCEAVSALEGQTVPHLTAAAMNGTNITAYAATQMAIARNATDPHSRAVYDYIVKHGASADLMELLTAANIMQNMDKTQRNLLQSSIRVGNSFLTGEQLESVSSLYAKAQSAYQWYQDVLEQHKKSDAQKRVNEDARIAMYDAQIAELSKMIATETDPSLHETLIHKQTDNAKARQQAIDAKTEEQNRRAERMASTQKDLNSARESAEHAKNEYTRKLMRHAAAYMQRMGDVYQGIMAKDHLSRVTIASKAAAVNYADAENLKDVQEIIRSSEKAAAVALGRALGVTVEIVEFTDEFFDEKKVPNEQRNYDSNGVTIDGKVYLNEKSITAEVGSGTNAVILHEIGHVMEASADNYAKYAKFARQYFETRDGKESVDRWIASFVESGMTEENANKELVAEFTRQVALADPRAIRALTKSAPIMSTRIFQWLTNMNSSLTPQAREQANTLRDAQREFAKALKAVKKNGTGSISSTYDIAATREAFANAVEALNERAQLEEQAQKQTTEQPAQPTQSQPQAEQKTETPATTEETQAQPAVEETEQTAETVEEQPTEESVEEEPAAEEQPVEEPQEDFADVVLEEPQGDPDYLGYDEPTEVGKVESIKGETLADDEDLEDSEGNLFTQDENGNLVPYEPSATQTEETPTQTETAEQTEEPADLWSTDYKKHGYEGQSNSSVAILDALKVVNHDLANEYESESSSTRIGGYPVLNAVINVANDVRQQVISPMAAATYLSNAYNAANGDIYHAFDGMFTKAGNLKKTALNEIKAIDANHAKESTQNATTTEAERVETPTLTQPVDDASAPAEAESPVEQPTTTEQAAPAQEQTQEQPRTEQAETKKPKSSISKEMKPLVDAFIEAERKKVGWQQPKVFKKTTAAKNAQSVLKNAKVVKNGRGNQSKEITYAYTDDAGRQTLTDRYRAYRFNKELDGLPKLPDGWTYPHIGDMLDRTAKSNKTEVPMPSLVILEELSKNKSNADGKRLNYSFGENMPSFNAKYLYELCQTFPNAKLYIDSTKGAASNLYAVSENGDALLVPVKSAATVDAETANQIKADIRQYASDLKDMMPYITDESIDEFINNYAADAITKGIQPKTTRSGSKAQYYTEYDPEYLDLARRYESGDKSVEAELRKAVDAAAKRAGYTVKAYHGTNRIFYSFRGANEMGYHFGTKAAAHGRVGRGKAARIIPAYLRANNPVIFDYDMGSWDANFRLANDLYEKDVISADELNEIKYGRDGERRFVRSDVSANRILQNILKAKGYDSIKYKNTMETKSSWSYIVFDAEQAKSADLITKDDNGNIIPLSERFKTDRTGEDAWKNEDIRYYTEYNPQALAVQRNIDDMTDMEKSASGNPRMLQTENGPVVVRTFTKNGFTSGNPMTNGNGLQNIAMIAPVAAFENGFVDRAVPASKCTAVVIPNTDEYADMRTDARDAGAYVYGYDPSDPSMLDRAIDRAKDAQSVQYMPQMRYEDFIEKYGAHPYGAEPRVKNRPVPRQTTDTNRVSRMASNAATSPLTTDQGYEDIQGWIADNGTGTYMPQSNNRVLNRARGIIERAGSINQAAADLDRDVANGAGKATDLLARAELLYAQTQDPNSGLSILEREKIFGNLCIIASDAGRSLQLASRLKYMTPEGHIAYIEQVGKRMSEKYEKRTGKRTVLKPTQEEIDAYKGAQTVDEMKEIDKKVRKRFFEETSDLTWIDRVRNWRYFAMLGNPRTHFRNIVGNALMNPVARVKDSINSIYQLGMDKSDRTTSFVTNRVDANTREFVNQMLTENLPLMQGVSEKYMEGVDNQSVRTIGQAWKTDVKSAALTKGRTAIGRALNRLSSFNSNMLELEDAWALSRRFRSSMYQIIQARGIDVNNITEQQKSDIVNYAMEESLRATFRDASALADALNKFANTNKATRLAMEAIVPFKRTPINIAKRSVEYSPIGLVNGLYKLFSANRAYNTDIKNIESMRGITDEERAAMRADAENTLKQSKVRAIDRLAAGTTGSLMTIIGMFASAMGWISIGRKDDEEAAFEQGLGKSTYSLNIGDLSIDLSAFSPAAVPLLMGTALYQSVGAEHDENFVSSMISVLAESVDPVTEMSMLSGIADALSSTSYGNEEGRNTRWFGAIAGNALESYVGQFVPTIVGQATRIADPYTRSYSAGDDYWGTRAFGSEIGSSVLKIQNKVFPWLSEPKVDIHGEPVRNYTNFGAGIAHVLNNTILPATIKFENKTEIDDELIRLYGVVDSADIFPQKPSRNLGSYKNEPIKITSDKEYAEYQKDAGQTVYDMLDDLISSPYYQRMTDTQKAEAVERVVEQAKTSTRKRWKAIKVTGGK